ncbi:cystatin-like [Pseudophryne corroboree]|uniref:cystatin-like n=1 Tax=Pseudophryne corroboree TaxID=495146 RepID=UPI00308125D4
MAKLCVLAAILAVFIAVTQAERFLGGKTDANENDDGVKRALKFAENEFNKRSNDLYMCRVNDVRRAQRQLVSGISYTLDVEMIRTLCRKPTTDLTTCALHTDPTIAKKQNCIFEVNHVPWKDSTQLIKMKCE